MTEIEQLIAELGNHAFYAGNGPTTHALLQRAASALTKLTAPVTEEEVEATAKAHYEEHFSGVEDLEPAWAAAKHEGRAVDPSYWHRMRQSQRIALTSFLKGRSQ